MPSRQLLDSPPFASPSVALPIASPPIVGRGTSHRTLVVSLAVGGTLCCVVALVALALLVYYRRLKASRTSPCDVSPAVKLQKFSYRELKAATHAFNDSQKLGQGGFGSVYKGLLRDGTEIAVKKLDRASLQGEREFQNEVTVIGRVNSPHIVSLLGYCSEGKRRLLVYEFMARRSLQEALFDEYQLVPLDWEKRFKIILDTAGGLAFLHFKCDPPIIHGDVKPSNILLDSSLSARIADFGLARLKSEVQIPERSEEGERESIERERIRYERVARDRARRQRRREEAERKRVEEEKAKAATLAGGREPISEIGCAAEEEEEVGIGEHIDKDDVRRSLEFPPLEEGNEEVVADGEENREAAVGSPTQAEEIRVGVEYEAFESAEEGTIDDTKSIATSKDGTPGGPRAAAASGTEEGDGEGWSTISPSQPDLDLSGDNKEVHLLATKTKEHKDKSRRMSWSRDWWWKQDTSHGEHSMRDYVFDWRSESKRMKSKEGSLKDHDCGSEISFEAGRVERRRRESRRHRSKSSEWLGDIIGELSKECKKKQVKRDKSKGREWWREEYCDELSSKSRELKKGEGSRTRSREWWRDEYSEELAAKSKELKKRRDREFSSREVSGELSHSRKLKARGDTSLRERSRSREYWSGDLLSRGVSSTPSMRGTICYVAPEYGGGGMLSEKSDVYSFGVLLLVLISGRRPLQVNASPITEFERANLISWARYLAQTGNVLDLVDPTLQEGYLETQAYLCISVALLCLQRLPATRPNMGEVVKILSGEAEVPALPFEFSPSPPGGLSFKSRRKPSEEKLNIDIPLLP